MSAYSSADDVGSGDERAHSDDGPQGGEQGVAGAASDRRGYLTDEVAQRQSRSAAWGSRRPAAPMGDWDAGVRCPSRISMSRRVRAATVTWPPEWVSSLPVGSSHSARGGSADQGASDDGALAFAAGHLGRGGPTCGRRGQRVRVRRPPGCGVRRAAFVGRAGQQPRLGHEAQKAAAFRCPRTRTSHGPTRPSHPSFMVVPSSTRPHI